MNAVQEVWQKFTDHSLFRDLQSQTTTFLLNFKGIDLIICIKIENDGIMPMFDS